MPYLCCHCSRELRDDHLLGQTVGTLPNARVCDAECANAWEASRAEKTDWTWLSMPQWIQRFRKGLQGHPFYIQAADDEPIWRYLDLPKFLDLLQTRELYLTAAHLLGDPFEGSLSEGTIRRLEAESTRVAASFAAAVPDYDAATGRESVLQGLRGNHQWERQWTYVSCWHVNAYESAAMWAVYAGRSGALAIKANVRSLRACVERHQEPPHGYRLVARVRYRDYAREPVDTGFVLAPLLQKRKSFQHENELRIITQQLPHLGSPSIEGQQYDYSRTPIPGIRLEVDLESLIEEIFVAPSAPSWFLNVVTSVAAKYGLHVPVRQSELLEGQPVF
jgi:hypothetical protein